MYKDHIKREELHRKYPNRMKEIVFENFVQNAMAATSGIYKFLGMPMPVEVRKWLETHTVKSKNIATKWRKGVDKSKSVAITSSNKCTLYYNIMRKFWK